MNQKLNHHHSASRTGWLRTALILFLLTFAAGLQSSADPAPMSTLDEVAAQLPHGDVAGRVVDKSGRPLPGADIFVYYARDIDGLRDRLAGRTKTDAQGCFRLDKVIVWEPANEYIARGITRPTAYYVIARHPTAGINYTPLHEGDPTSDVEVTLLGARYAEPKVIDGDGKPVEGARVYISRGYREIQGKPEAVSEEFFRLYRDIGLSSGVTGKDGKVRLLSLKNGSYSSEKEGLVDGFQLDSSTPAVMTPSAQVSGVVTDLDGRPVPGAMVMFEYEGKGANFTGAVGTDAQGRYCFKNAPCSGYHFSWARVQGKADQGKMTLRVDDLRYHSPFLSDPVTFTIDPGQKLEKNIRLARVAVLEGTIVDLNTGRPLGRMPFEAIIGHTPWPNRVTDSRGGFWLKVPRGSDVSISWQRSGRGHGVIDEDWIALGNWSTKFGVLNEDKKGLKLKIKRWQFSPLSGRITDDQGRGVANASVYLHPNIPPVRTAGDGRFKLEAGPNDRDFELYAISDDGAQAGLARFQAGAKDVTLLLAPARPYHGQVVNNLGEPGNNLQFTMQPVVNGLAFYRLPQTVQAGATGIFITPPLCPQSQWEIRWESDQKINRDYSFGLAWLDLARLKPEESIRIVAPRYLNSLMGKVVDEKGAPVAGARFQLAPWNATGLDARGKLPASRKDGSFTLNNLAEGEATLTASASGYKSRALRVPTDAIDCSITLRSQTAPTTCKVTVVNESHQPLAGMPVALRLKLKSGDTVTTILQTLKTDQQGHCGFTWPPLDLKASGEGLVGVDLPGKAWTYAGFDPSHDEDILLIVRAVMEHPRGQIVDISGKPVAGALLRLLWINRFDGPFETYNANAKAHVGEFLEIAVRTDAAGRYIWPRLGLTDHYEMSISALGMAERSIRVYDEHTREQRHILIPCGNLRAHLIIRGGGSLAGGVAWLHSEQDRLNEPGKPYPLQPDGMLLVKDLLPNPYDLKTVIIQGKHYVCSTPGTFQVESAETATPTLELEESILFKGRLIDEQTDRPPTGRAWMTATPAEGFQSIDGIDSDEEGRFQFRLPAGKFDFSYNIPGMRLPGHIKAVPVTRESTGEERTFKVKVE